MKPFLTKYKKAMDTLNKYAFNSEGLKPLESVAAYMQRERRDLIFMMRTKILNFMITFFPVTKEFLII